VSGDRSLALAWYGGVLGGLLPVLLLGFLYSALADRTVFVLWALVVGACWVVLLRQGLSAGWARIRLLGALALLLAAGLAIFAALESWHHEILDLGFRAVFPGIYHPSATAPRTVGVVAAALGIVGAACLAVGGRHLKTPEHREVGKSSALPFEASPPGPLSLTGEGEGDAYSGPVLSARPSRSGSPSPVTERGPGGEASKGMPSNPPPDVVAGQEGEIQTE
jgi:hypothetical protein